MKNIKKIIGSFLSLLILFTSLCFISCKDNKETKKYNFKNISIAPVSYSFLLDENINERKIRIPLLFEYQPLNGEVDCSVKSFDGENINDIDVSCIYIGFGVDKDTKYLIPNVELSVKFVGKGNFSKKTINNITLKIADTTIEADVDINIYDRTAFGEYNNLDSFLKANLVEINVLYVDYTDWISITANKSVNIKSIEYIDGSKLESFKFSLNNDKTNELDLKSENNSAINIQVNNGIELLAVWDLPEKSGVSYFGTEAVLKYDYNGKIYIDTYFMCICYSEIINSIIKKI